MDEGEAARAAHCAHQTGTAVASQRGVVQGIGGVVLETDLGVELYTKGNRLTASEIWSCGRDGEEIQLASLSVDPIRRALLLHATGSVNADGMT
jgi:hypothetical protein